MWLFDASYEQTIHPNVVKHVFSAAPSKERFRKSIFGKLKRMRLLRNRAFHHEPLWRGIQMNNVIYPVEALYNELIALICWMEPAVGQQLTEIDRFSDVLAAEPVFIRA